MAGLPMSTAGEAAPVPDSSVSRPADLRSARPEARREPALVLRIALWAALSALFTLAVVQYSLRHGRLIRLPTYDDVAYLCDGLERLEILYHDGVAGLLRAHMSRWPHSPFSTYLALASFAVLGPHDWAPYAGNVIIVFVLLAFVDHVFRGLPMSWRIAGALFALSTPAAGVSVCEYRPDLACGLLTAMGVVLLLEQPLLAASLAQRRAAGACFGLALAFKPPIAPLTVAVLAVSLAVALVSAAGLRDVLRDRRPWRAAVAVVWPALLVGAWPFVFNGAYYVDYFRLALFAPQKPIADFRGNWVDQMKYYVVGGGGHMLLGGHVQIILAVLVLGTAYLWWRGDGVAVASIRNQLAPLAVAHVVPTLNPVKQPFFGATFAVLLILLGLEVAADVARAAPYGARSRRWAATALGAALLTGIFTARNPAYWGQTGDATIVAANQAALEISTSIRDLSLPPGSTVFLTSVGAINPETLRYMGLKSGATTPDFVTLNFAENTGDVGRYRKRFDKADAVLASEGRNPDVYTGLPNGLIQDQVLEMLRARTDYALRRAFPTSGGAGGYLLFEKIGPFFGWQPLEGFLAEEGPYPQWSLPRVRWGTGPRSALSVRGADGGKRMIVLQGRPNAPELTMTIDLDGVEIGRHTFHRIDLFDRVAVPLGVVSEGSRVELRYGTWDKSDTQARAVLFRRLKIVSDHAPDEAAVDSAPPAPAPPPRSR